MGSNATVTSTYDQDRQWLMIRGLVARQMATHALAPRPKRDSLAANFDELGGNTMLGVHLSEIAAGGTKRGHRHVDEAVIYIVTGRGWSELRQSDDRPVQRVDWRSGDLLSIPANAWHQHFNADPASPSRQLAFKNTRLLRRLFGSRDFVYANQFRFTDRFADEPEYFSHADGEDQPTRANFIAACRRQPLIPAAEMGDGVSWRRYEMGGQRTLDVRIFGITPHGHMGDHAPLAEEAILVLDGRGTTRLRANDGRGVELEWEAGDLLCPPLGAWRRHEARGDSAARLLVVRNDFLSLALGQPSVGLETPAPRRFPEGMAVGDEMRSGPEDG